MFEDSSAGRAAMNRATSCGVKSVVLAIGAEKLVSQAQHKRHLRERGAAERGHVQGKQLEAESLEGDRPNRRHVALIPTTGAKPIEAQTGLAGCS